MQRSPSTISACIYYWLDQLKSPATQSDFSIWLQSIIRISYYRTGITHIGPNVIFPLQFLFAKRISTLEKIVVNNVSSIDFDFELYHNHFDVKKKLRCRHQWSVFDSCIDTISVHVCKCECECKKTVINPIYGNYIFNLDYDNMTGYK